MGALNTLLGNATSAGSSQGGSVNSASNLSQNVSNSSSQSFSRTYGTEASLRSYEEAVRAHERQREFFNTAMAYNDLEAQKQRDWQEEMANTIYTRSVKNMIEAGINPVLAASAGLSAANVGSGASANISTPSTFMGQTFADQVSGSGSISHSEGFSKGSSSGSSWENSKWGLAEAIEQMGDFAENTINQINSGFNNATEKYPLISGIISGITGATASIAQTVSADAVGAALSKNKNK